MRKLKRSESPERGRRPSRRSCSAYPSHLNLVLPLPRIFFYPKCSLSPTPLLTSSPPRYTLYADRYPSRATKCASFHTSVIRFRVTSHERRATNLPRDHLRKRLQKIRIFSNIFKRFASFFEYFRIFSNVFNRFRTFSKRTCAFGRAFILPGLPNRYILTLPQ